MAPANAKSPIKSTGRSPPAYNQKRSAKVRSGAITPIIKIVHVYAPTLVRTDVANFRALVQEMTGNEAASCHNMKDINTVGSATTTQEPTDESMSRKLDKVGANSARMSKAQACGTAHREEAGSKASGGSRGGEVCGRPSERPGKSWESSCEQYSVDSYFAEEVGCVDVDDHLYKMQQTYCSAYFATTTYTSSWRPPLQDIPGGFESFDCF